MVQVEAGGRSAADALGVSIEGVERSPPKPMRPRCEEVSTPRTGVAPDDPCRTRERQHDWIAPPTGPGPAWVRLVVTLLLQQPTETFVLQ